MWFAVVKSEALIELAVPWEEGLKAVHERTKANVVAHLDRLYTYYTWVIHLHNHYTHILVIIFLHI